MKKITTSIILLSSMLIFSCQKATNDNVTDTATNEQKILGKWMSTALIFHYKDFSGASKTKDFPAADVAAQKISVEYFADKTQIFMDSSMEKKYYTYKIVNDNLTQEINSDNPDGTLCKIIKLDNTDLVLTTSVFSGDTFYWDNEALGLSDKIEIRYKK